MHEANNLDNKPQAVEKKRRKIGRIRLAGMIYPIKRAIPEQFYRLGDSEAVAEGYNVCRPDVVDRAILALEHRVRLLEGWRNLGCNEPMHERKPIQSETAPLVIIPRKTA